MGQKLSWALSDPPFATTGPPPFLVVVVAVVAAAAAAAAALSLLPPLFLRKVMWSHFDEKENCASDGLTA